MCGTLVERYKMRKRDVKSYINMIYYSPKVPVQVHIQFDPSIPKEEEIKTNIKISERRYPEMHRYDNLAHMII